MSSRLLPRLLHGWSLLALLALSIVLPPAIFAWTAWSERGRTMAEAEASARRTVIALHEQTARVLETHELVLAEVIRQVEGRAWPLAADEGQLWSYLTRIARDVEGVASITLADEEGRVRLDTRTWPAPAEASLAGHESFLEHAEGRVRGTHVGPARPSPDGPQIALSRKLLDEDGGFAGIAQVTVPLAQFTGFWERFAPTISHVIPLVRSDGVVVARYPAAGTPERLRPDGPFLSHALAQREGSFVAVSPADGVERLSAFTRVKDHPLHIGFSVETRALLTGWRQRMELLGFYSAVAVAALLGMSLMAVRQYRQQRAAAEAWRQAADRLREEMAAREAAEAQLRRAQTLDAVGQLTAGVAHDFNNLLQAVRSGLFLLRKRAAPGDEAARGIADGALQAVERGARLVRQLMIFARRERLEPRAIDLRALVAGMGELLQKALGTGIHVEAELPEGLEPVMADPTQTELAILNLAINARDAMPHAQGRLTIAARNLVTGGPDAEAGLKPGRYVALSIADTGLGMTEEVMRRALEPFFTTKAPGHGTGLGLSMVHGFVTASGGAVRIESRPGQGTRITLYLPRAAVAVERDAAPEGTESPAAPGGTVLLVDDDALGRLATAEALRELGHEVLEARAGDEALLLLRWKPGIELLVTDYAMPGMTGAELADAAREMRPDMPVMMITGHAAASPEELEHGTVCLLRKPFRVEELDRRIRTTLASRGGVAPPSPVQAGEGGAWPAGRSGRVKAYAPAP